MPSNCSLTFRYHLCSHSRGAGKRFGKILQRCLSSLVLNYLSRTAKLYFIPRLDVVKNWNISFLHSIDDYNHLQRFKFVFNFSIILRFFSIYFFDLFYTVHRSSSSSRSFFNSSSSILVIFLGFFCSFLFSLHIMFTVFSSLL